MSPIDTFKDLQRRFRTSLVRWLLVTSQLVLSAMALTISLSTLLSPMLQSSVGAVRFNVVTGNDPTSTLFGEFPLFTQSQTNALLVRTPSVNSVALYQQVLRMTLSVGSRNFKIRQAALVTPEYMSVENIELVAGQGFQSTGNTATALISEQVARQVFGDQQPLRDIEIRYSLPGRSLLIRRSVRIIGVFRVRPGLEPAYMPALLLPRQEGTFSSSVLAVLAKPNQGDAARSAVLSSIRTLYGGPLARQAAGTQLQIAELSAFSGARRVLSPIAIVFLLFSLVAMVISGIGLFSIGIVELAERQSELALQRILGATLTRMTQEFLAPFITLVLVSSMIGILLAIPFTKLLAQLVGSSLFTQIALSWQPLAALLAFSVMMAAMLLVGLLMNAQARRISPLRALRGN